MSKQSLTDATRKFKFFPTIAELSEFFCERRAERLSSAGNSGEMPPAKVNSIARLAMRGWTCPKLPYRGQRAWEAWALSMACEAVRQGRIAATFRQSQTGLGYVLDATVSAPIVPDDLFEEWKALPLSAYEDGSP